MGCKEASMKEFLIKLRFMSMKQLKCFAVKRFWYTKLGAEGKHLDRNQRKYLQIIAIVIICKDRIDMPQFKKCFI